MTYMWDYGDGSDPDDTGVHMYQDTGRYTVRLTAENFCGSQTITRIIEVLGTPQADFAVVDGGGTSLDTVCIGELVTLDGASSDFATSYRWRISPRGAVFENDTRDRDEQPEISLFGGGDLYHKSGCGQQLPGGEQCGANDCGAGSAAIGAGAAGGCLSEPGLYAGASDAGGHLFDQRRGEEYFSRSVDAFGYGLCGGGPTGK